MPDFQQFAEMFSREVYASKLPGNGGGFWLAQFKLEAAERHARLLQQIWEWAEANTPAVTFYAPGQLETRWNFDEGIRHSQAHVRSLLVGQKEAK